MTALVSTAMSTQNPARRIIGSTDSPDGSGSGKVERGTSGSDTEQPPTPSKAAARGDTGRPVLVVLGKDDSGKPHASWFSEADAELAAKAAQLMGMSALRIGGDELRALATKLPEGRVFASGRAFVPFVKASLYEALATLPQSLHEKASASNEGGKAAAESAEQSAADKYPTDWSRIGKGSVVLAKETPSEPWYEAVVMEVRSENLLSLRWLDFEGYPAFVRRREHVGLLHPSFSAA